MKKQLINTSYEVVFIPVVPWKDSPIKKTTAGGLLFAYF